MRNVNVQWGRINLDDLLTMEVAEGELERYAVAPGDLLVCEGGEIGRNAIWRGRTEYLAYQKALHRVRPHADLEPRYLSHLLRRYANDGTLASVATGSTIAHLPQQRLRALPVPLPPLDEQRRIVAVLEDHLSRLDAADAYLAAGLRRAGRLSEAVLERALSSTNAPLTPVAEVLAAPLANGRSVSDQEDGFPVLRLTSLRDGWIDRLQHKRGRWSMEEARPYLIRDGDFLVARGNGSLALVGRGGLVTKGGPDVAFPDTLIRIRPAIERVLPKYLRLAWHMRSVRDQIEPQARTTAGIYKVNQPMISSVKVPIPSLADQQAVVDEVAAAHNEGQRLTASVSGSRRRTEAFRRALLTAAFTGRLTGRSRDLDVVEELAEATA